MASIPVGSSPESGSSSTSSSGSCTRAAASCTRCWLPWDSVSTFESRRSAISRRSSQLSVAAAPRGRAQPVQPAQVLDLLADEHARVQPALLGHVAEAAAFGLADRGPVPADRTRLRDRSGRRWPASSSSCRPRSARGSRRPVRRARRRRGRRGRSRPVRPAQSFQLEQSVHWCRLFRQGPTLEQVRPQNGAATLLRGSPEAALFAGLIKSPMLTTSGSRDGCVSTRQRWPFRSRSPREGFPRSDCRSNHLGSRP